MTAVAQIAGKLPHRYPLLLVDRVVEFVPGQRIRALKAVTASEPWFRESLLSNPDIAFFPPALLIESWCQAAALLVVWEAPRPSVLRGEVPLLGTLSEVGFHGLVEPGSVVHHHANLVRDLGDSFIFDGAATVDGHPVLTIGQMLMVIRPVAAVMGRSLAAQPNAGCVIGY